MTQQLANQLEEAIEHIVTLRETMEEMIELGGMTVAICGTTYDEAKAREVLAAWNTRSPVEGAVAGISVCSQHRERVADCPRCYPLHPPVAVPVVDEAMARDAARYRWWRENFGFIEEDGDGIVGCAFSCQIQLPILQSASHAELFDMVADYHLTDAALSTATKESTND